MTRPQYNVVLVNQAGGERNQLVRAQVLAVTWELDGWGEARWVMDVDDPQIATEPVLADADAITPPREVQIWRAGRLEWWGIPTGVPSCDGYKVTFTAYGLLWYFARRYFGPTYSNTIASLLVNGDFERTPASYAWSVTGSLTAAATTRRKFGEQALRLTTSGATDQYIAQPINMPTPARSRPLLVTASGWVYPETVTTPTFQDRGIYIYDSVTFQEAWVAMNADVPRNEWSRLETQLELPAAASAHQLVVGYYAPDNGAVVWDNCRVDYQQRTGALEGQDWGDDYLRRVFNYGAGNSNGGSTGPGGIVAAQDQWWGSRYRKSSLGMTFLGSNLAAGQLRSDVYWDHEDHGQVYEAMLEVVKRNLLDFEVVWNRTGTVRQLATYPPRKGSLRSHMLVELGRDISGLGYTVDGRRTANDVRVIGRNQGKTKEVGQAGGPVPWTLGSLQLESVLAAPDEVEGHGLAQVALWEERKLRRPVATPTIRVPAGPYLNRNQRGGPLTVGDTLPVRVRQGWLRDVLPRRVVKMTLLPATEELDLVTNDP